MQEQEETTQSETLHPDEDALYEAYYEEEGPVLRAQAKARSAQLRTNLHRGGGMAAED